MLKRMLLGGAVLVGCAAPLEPVVTPKAVTFIGDSITNHLFTLSNWFGPVAAAWVNAGVEGDKSYSVLARTPAVLAQSAPQVVHLLVGVNDLLVGAGSGGTAQDIVPPGRPENSGMSVGGTIDRIVHLIAASGARPILGTVLPAAHVCAYADATALNANVRTLNVWIRAYAQANDILLIDYYAAFVGADGYGVDSLYQSDGLHPTYTNGDARLAATTLAAFQAARILP